MHQTSRKRKRSDGSDDEEYLEVTSEEKKGGTPKIPWRLQGFAEPEACPLFHPGLADFSPGWFMQRHEVSHIVFNTKMNDILIPPSG
jgi:hypothetical protein